MKIWKYHCYKKLAERDDDFEVGIFFLEGTLQGGKFNLNCCYIIVTIHYQENGIGTIRIHGYNESENRRRFRPSARAGKANGTTRHRNFPFRKPPGSPVTNNNECYHFQRASYPVNLKWDIVGLHKDETLAKLSADRSRVVSCFPTTFPLSLREYLLSLLQITPLKLAIVESKSWTLY
jgi:hypothetical protein